ncbi:MAG: aminotransferase class V-fold PLP-dependent enzyme, partial [Phycisphaerales bacterium]|nr:aminotransferase class V-fold PLP-dependent enzyme [Phycisphaerales bacterium]
NLAIFGIASHCLTNQEPCHFVTTSMAHNSVLRPFHMLKEYGITFTIVDADPETGLVNPDNIQHAITPETKLIAVAHGSNVTGTLQDLHSIGEVSGEIPFLVDAAQTMGHVPIDVQAMNIDMLAFPGHKGLLGPLGTGGLLMKHGLEKVVNPSRYGGTGSESELPTQPTTLPDYYESGSHNTIGIAGLLAGVRWIQDQGLACIHEHELALCQAFIEGINTIEGVSIIGPQVSNNRCAVFSLQTEIDPHQFANMLEEECGACVRAGLHCAPFAHETMGTTNRGGTVRISFGPFHTIEDVQQLVEGISRCTQQVLI